MYASAARMVWAIYWRRLTRVTPEQRAALYDAAEDLSAAHLISLLPARGAAGGGVRAKAARRRKPAP